MHADDYLLKIEQYTKSFLLQIVIDTNRTRIAY
jgi:hypothetical protein